MNLRFSLGLTEVINLILFFKITVTLLGSAQTTWISVHRYKMGCIRAASLADLLFVGLAHLTENETLLAMQPVCFGSTNVVMSEPRQFSDFMMLLAGFLFDVIFYLLQLIDFTIFRGGVGGTLGGAAFVSCLIVSTVHSSIVRFRWSRHP